MTEEPKLRINDREELIYMLAEAAAIEHNVMCSYFYGIWSLKRGQQDGLTAEQAEIVQGWKRAFTEIAVEEMTHLTLVGNLACAIGAAPHLSRPNFPIPFGYHPSAIELELFGFSPALIDHGIFLERPEGVDLRDAAEFVHPSHYHRKHDRNAVMPSAQDFETIGHLYRGIMHGFEALSAKLGEENLFCGDVADQISPKEAPLPGLCVVTDLKTAQAAVEMIVEQGEGAPEHSEESHYARLVALREVYYKMIEADPSFEPAFPVARNPVPQEPIDPENRVWINHPETVKVLDLANAIYGHMLRFLVQAYGRDGGEDSHKAQFTTLARELMSVLTPVCEHLASLPANPDYPGVNAGMTFTMLRDIARLPSGPGEMRMLSERMGELSDQADRIFAKGHELDGIADALRAMGAKIKVPGAPPPKPAPHKPHDDRPKPEGHKREKPVVGRNEGRDMILSFDTSRCIHARFCVLGAPKVFLSGVEGQWIFPDEMDTETLRGVCHNCPSGAIYYEPKGDTPPEPAPKVNIVNLRENGPYAFRAPMTIDGRDEGFRRTLCRCGASKNKPFCDGSHVDIGFTASGEPETRPSKPLDARDGPLEITPQKNGPLLVSGNLEICAGTGRNIDRVTTARLCRCGGSKTKPFCDNTHLKIGFKSDE